MEAIPACKTNSNRLTRTNNYHHTHYQHKKTHSKIIYSKINSNLVKKTLWIRTWLKLTDLTQPRHKYLMISTVVPRLLVPMQVLKTLINSSNMVRHSEGCRQRCRWTRLCTSRCRLINIILNTRFRKKKTQRKLQSRRGHRETLRGIPTEPPKGLRKETIRHTTFWSRPTKSTIPKTPI